MASGTFVQGASIELTADGPLRSPYGVSPSPNTAIQIKKM
jgi:cystathionine beta-lyase family protein involved in aluminum resistance